MADVLRLSEVETANRCPRCAGADVKRTAKRSREGLWKMIESCRECGWHRSSYVRT